MRDNLRMPVAVIAILLAAQSSYARPELLADTAWLGEHLNDPAVRIVDMRPPSVLRTARPRSCRRQPNSKR
jgi:hypothetical protein